MIPRIIHQFWVGGPVPDHLAAFMETWRAHHPDWEHRLWGDDDFRGWLRNQDLFDRADEIAPGSGNQMRSDIARYEVLHRFGGVYVDADFECLRPVDPLCGVEFWTAWEMDGRWANMAIAGSVPEHPLLEELIARLPANVEAHKGRRPNWLTGPRFLTPILRRHPEVAVHPASMFYPYQWHELDRQGEHFPDAWAVHHWNNARTNPVMAPLLRRKAG